LSGRAALAAVVALAALGGAARAAQVTTKVPLMVREKPSQNARAVERVAAGRRLPLLGRSGEWVHVQIGRKDGWIPAAQVTGLARARGEEAQAAGAEEPLATKRPVRPEAWVEQSRYHDGMGPERVQVTASRTDLIARPTDNAQVVGMSRRGESLNVVRVSRDNRWYLVELGGGEVAWISSQAVRAIGVPPNTTKSRRRRARSRRRRG
jgi:uncharacterized protein YgiM (DUF1202 family)